MVKIRVMYWKEIPIQIQAKDKDNTKSHQLSDKFQVTIDKVAMFDGSYGAEEYLEGWSYGPEIDLDMNISNAINFISEKFEEFDGDLVQIIAEKWKKNIRSEKPGSINYLFKFEDLGI